MVEEVLPVNCGPDPLLVIHRKETWVWHMFQRQQLSHPYALLECDLAVSSSSGRITALPPGSGQACVTFTERVHGSYTAGLLRLSQK